MQPTRQEKWRIGKIKAERLARENKLYNKQNLPEKLKKPQTGLVITTYGLHFLVEDKSGRLYKCTKRQNIEFAVAGDNVKFQKITDDSGVITSLKKRNNKLKRGSKIIAANINKLWLVVAIEPHYQFELIDRYLIIANSINLEIGIIVNKIELRGNFEKLDNDFSMYQNIGYDTIYISVKEKVNINTLKKALNDKNQIFLGQSGVGKSSLINALIPDLNLKVDKISAKSKLGKHTTTNTTLYHIPSGGNLFDSPGIREFQLDNLSAKDISNGFIEFKKFNDKCKFRNCNHINEPDCAIKNAVRTKQIHQKRYNSYLNLTLIRPPA